MDELPKIFVYNKQTDLTKTVSVWSIGLHITKRTKKADATEQDFMK